MLCVNFDVVIWHSFTLLDRFSEVREEKPVAANIYERLYKKQAQSLL